MFTLDEIALRLRLLGARAPVRSADVYFIYDKSSIFVLFSQMTFVLIFALYLWDLKKDIVR